MFYATALQNPSSDSTAHVQRSDGISILWWCVCVGVLGGGGGRRGGKCIIFAVYNPTTT